MSALLRGENPGARLGLGAAIVGGVALLICLVGALLGPGAFFAQPRPEYSRPIM